jgi:hypothetical protein
MMWSAPALSQSNAEQARLLVADVAAGVLHVYDAADARLLTTIADLQIAAHAGVIALSDGRVLVPDDRNKQLLVLRISGDAAPIIERRVPMPIPLPTRYAWAAVDPSEAIFAATGLDSDESVKILTLVDLKSYSAKQFRVDTGSADAELNLALGGNPDPVIILHMAEKVESYRVSDLFSPEAKINGILDGTVKPTSTVSVGKGGHSNSYSKPTNTFTASTLRGFELATLDGNGALTGHKVLSWEANGRGGGRNARQRLTRDGRYVFGPLNASIPPAQWADAEVDLHWVELPTGTTSRAPLARGAVGRGGVSGRLAVYASIHPDGDIANLVDLNPASPSFRTVVARVALPKLANGPVAGQPTTGRESRHSAISPDGRLAFVTQGGEARVHVIDTAAKAIVRTIDTPTPLKGGGYIVAVQPGVSSADYSAR